MFYGINRKAHIVAMFREVKQFALCRHLQIWVTWVLIEPWIFCTSQSIVLADFFLALSMGQNDNKQGREFKKQIIWQNHAAYANEKISWSSVIGSPICS